MNFFMNRDLGFYFAN